MAQKLFTEINARLLEKLKGDNTYQGEVFNYFKVFQHGVVYAINASKNKIQRTYFHYPLFLQILRFILKKDETNWKEINLKKNVWLEPARVFQANATESRSMYGFKMKAFFGETLTSVKIRKQHDVSADYDISVVSAEGGPLDDIEKKLFKDVVTVARNLRKSVHYTAREKEYILSSLHVFFVQFRKYHKLLRGKKVERLFYIVHYHNEAIAAACKLNNVKCIELQHGLINRNDLYYVYNTALKDSLKNAMFPDKILLYGSYWKNVLSQGSEWTSEQLIVAGNYLATEDQISTDLQKENLIIVAAQKGMHNQYLPLIEKLTVHLERHADWKVIVKLHPTEPSPEAYQTISHKQIAIAASDANIRELLERSKIQLSIYSTTFFDAAGLDVMNFSWITAGIGSDYAASLVEEGVALALAPDADPIQHYSEKVSTYAFLERSAIYAPFNPKSFLC